jgi:type VI secretion system ImpA/VasJ family protein
LWSISGNGSKKVITECLKPINTEKPAGDACKNMDIYDPFQKEISKIINPSREKVNWEKLRDEAVSLLSETSKDIEIALYLTIALFKIDGYPGYLAGLRIFVGIIKTFPESYYPIGKTDKKTAKFRRGIIDTFNKRSVQYMTPSPARSDDAQSIQCIWDELQELQELKENISVPPPSLNDLLNRINDFKTKYPLKTTESQQPDNTEKSRQTADQPTQKVPETQQKTVVVQKPQVIVASSQKTGDFDKDAIKKANELRQENRFDPFPYRLKRLLLWDTQKELPPVNDGNTQLPCTPQMKKLQDIWLTPQKINESMVEELEKLFDNMRWWLDLQYAIVQTMTQIGTNYKQAIMAITQEVKYLLKRFPELPGYTFKKGEAFASPQTCLWLEGLTAESNSSFEFPSYLIDENLKEDLKEADNLAKDDKLSQALSKIQDGMRISVGIKDIFCRKMASARLCMEYQRVKEALIIFDHLFQQSQAFHLSKWDPLLFLELCQCYDKAAKRSPEQVSDKRKNEIASEILNLNVNFNL